jgi:hypothetical protein
MLEDRQGCKGRSHLKKPRAGDVAPWLSACLALRRPCEQTEIKKRIEGDTRKQMETDRSRWGPAFVFFLPFL